MTTYPDTATITGTYDQSNGLMSRWGRGTVGNWLLNGPGGNLLNLNLDTTRVPFGATPLAVPDVPVDSDTEAENPDFPDPWVAQDWQVDSIIALSDTLVLCRGFNVRTRDRQGQDFVDGDRIDQVQLWHQYLWVANIATGEAGAYADLGLMTDYTRYHSAVAAWDTSYNYLDTKVSDNWAWPAHWGLVMSNGDVRLVGLDGWSADEDTIVRASMSSVTFVQGPFNQTEYNGFEGIGIVQGADPLVQAGELLSAPGGELLRITPDGVRTSLAMVPNLIGNVVNLADVPNHYCWLERTGASWKLAVYDNGTVTRSDIDLGVTVDLDANPPILARFKVAIAQFPVTPFQGQIAIAKQQTTNDFLAGSITTTTEQAFFTLAGVQLTDWTTVHVRVDEARGGVLS